MLADEWLGGRQAAFLVDGRHRHRTQHAQSLPYRHSGTCALNGSGNSNAGASGGS